VHVENVCLVSINEKNKLKELLGIVTVLYSLTVS